MLFEKWFQNLKVKCGKWRVAQNVRRSLPGGAYVDLQLDHTKVWSAVEEASTASDLDYIPSVADIYAELSSQTGCQIQPPSVSLALFDQLSLPLIEAEKEEEIERRMYIDMFSVAETKPGQVQIVSTQVEHPALPDSEHSSNDSERNLSNIIESDNEGEDTEVQ